MSAEIIQFAEFKSEASLEEIRHNLVSDIVQKTQMLGRCPELEKPDYELWQSYATSFANEGQALLASELEATSHLQDPATQDVARIVLGLVQAEMDIRKELYAGPLPIGTIEKITINQRSQATMRSAVNEGWLYMDKTLRSQPWAVSQIGANIFKSHALKQVRAEFQLLSPPRSLRNGRLVGGTALRSL